MRPDTRPRAKKIPLTQEERYHLAHSARRRELLREARQAPAPSAAAFIERDRNDVALHLLDELETAVRGGDTATADLIRADARALGYEVEVVRVRNGVLRRIGFADGAVDEAKAEPVAQAALGRRVRHEAKRRGAPQSDARAQYVALGKAIDGGKARS